MTRNNKIEIYINLLEEGIAVRRPAMAEVINESLCKILPIPNYNPDDEKWEFPPGTLVQYETFTTNDKQNILIAVAPDRIKILEKIIKYQNLSDADFQSILSFPWDFTSTPATLSSKDIKHALGLYIEHKITATEIGEWANFLECREDVNCEELASKIISELANPEIYTPITPERAKLLFLKF